MAPTAREATRKNTSTIRRIRIKINNSITQGGRLIFFLALVPEVLLLGSLLLAHRIPGGHDGLQYFTLQHIFLNGAATSGETPLWLPFMSHGTVSTWWYAVQAAPLQQVFTLIAPRRETLEGTANPRVRQFFSLPLYWASYWSNQSFLYLDEPGSSFRIDHWQRPLDDFLRAYWNQPLEETGSTPKGLVRSERLVFPSEHPAAAKIAGLTEDKIQFFSKAVRVNSEQAVAGLMADPGYSGDTLFLTGPGPAPLPGEGRLRLPYRVKRFDSNHLEVVVEVPGSGLVWMLYSDVWHPGWKAAVNGKPAPVRRANLAYKAVRLEPGANRVEFSFRLPALDGLQRFFLLNAWGWVVGVLLLLSAEGTRGQSAASPPPGHRSRRPRTAP